MTVATTLAGLIGSLAQLIDKQLSLHASASVYTSPLRRTLAHIQSSKVYESLCGGHSKEKHTNKTLSFENLHSYKNECLPPLGV